MGLGMAPKNWYVVEAETIHQLIALFNVFPVQA